jgi:SAP domain
MKFWKGNRIDAGFEMSVEEVAARYMAYARENGVMAGHLQGLTVERSVRWWLTSPDHFNSVWEAETGADSLYQVLRLIAGEIYDSDAMRRARLQKLTMARLRAMLTGYGLATSGTKTELVGRLMTDRRRRLDDAT